MEQAEITVQPRSLKTARRVGACLLGAVAVMLPIAFTTHNDTLQFTLVAVSILLTGFALICLLGQDGKPDFKAAAHHASENGERDFRERQERWSRESRESVIPGTAAYAAYHGGKFYPD